MIKQVFIYIYLEVWIGNNSELLVKFYSKDKSKIVKNINNLIQSVDTDYFKLLKGYFVNINNQNSLSDFKECEIEK